MYGDDKSAEGILVNRHCAGAIAWSDGDLDSGLDQRRARTGSLRILSELGGVVGSRASPYSIGQCETSPGSSRSHTVRRSTGKLRK